jgi:hypothetical protein
MRRLQRYCVWLAASILYVACDLLVTNGHSRQITCLVSGFAGETDCRPKSRGILGHCGFAVEGTTL